MKHWKFLTKTELILLAMAALFAVFLLIHSRPSQAQEGWAVTSERAAQAEVLPPPVNINTASLSELETVEGIGETLAGRIIAYREENGPFATVDELEQVKGIGSATLENIRNLVCTEDTE